MAFTVSQLTEGFSTADQSSYDTDSISPAADSLLLFFVGVRDDDLNPPALCTVTAPSGVTIRGTFENPRFGTDDHYRHYYVMGFTNSSPGSGTCNLAFGDTMGYCAWSVIQIQGVDLTHGSGSGTEGLVQDRSLDLGNVADPSIQFLAATENSENLAIASFFREDTVSPWDPGSGWTQIHDQQDLFVEYRLTDGTQLTATTDTGTNDSHTGACIIEVAGGGAPQTVTPDFISGVSAVHNPTVTSLAKMLPDHIGPTGVVSNPTVTPLNVILPSFISGLSQVFEPSIPLLLKPDFISGVSQVFGPVVQGAMWTITPDHLASGTVVYSPVLIKGAAFMIPGFLGPTSQVFIPLLFGDFIAPLSMPTEGHSSFLIPPPVGRGILT